MPDAENNLAGQRAIRSACVFQTMDNERKVPEFPRVMATFR